ncbi:Rieske 2Fe-2S domain-containing protein [Litorivicinus sp.]|nr:Rieske 2Fe-2S domain-containing protein [Litorivicinus sp.]
MLTIEENELLTKVTGDAPMGQLMRQHWVPVCLIEELPEADCTPLLVEVFGERLVAFRDSNGNVGLLDELCPHRHASLLYGRSENCGLVCLYHGWKFDTSGHCTEMPSEPEGSQLINKVLHKAYPTREWGSFVWAWLGDPSKESTFEPPAFAPKEDTKVSVTRMRIPANWAQIMEGQIDSSHSSSLHSSDMLPARVEAAAADNKAWYRPSTDRSPRLQVERTDYGFHYAAIRHPIKQANVNDYFRITEFIAPFTCLIPPNSSYNVTTVVVPVDDSTSMLNFIAWGGETCPDTDEWRQFNHAVVGVDLDNNWLSKRQPHNRFLQDREAMKNGNFTGVPGIPNQDVIMWVSMGTVVNRTTDKLGASDQAVVEFRKLMVDAAKTILAGDPAIGTGPKSLSHVQIRSYEGVHTKETDWRTLCRA